MAEQEQVKTESSGAVRWDGQKARYDLIPPDALEVLARVYTVGAIKYSDRNWERGMTWGRCFSSLMRHAWAWARGEDTDLETGLPHMAHVAWNALALVTYQLRLIGTDDRAFEPIPQEQVREEQAEAKALAGKFAPQGADIFERNGH